MDRARTIIRTLSPALRAASASRSRAASTNAVAALLNSGNFGYNIQQCSAYTTRAAQEPFLSGSSSVYVEEMFKSWKDDPNSVHKASLFLFFRSWDL